MMSTFPEIKQEDSLDKFAEIFASEHSFIGSSEEDWSFGTEPVYSPTTHVMQHLPTGSLFAITSEPTPNCAAYPFHATMLHEGDLPCGDWASAIVLGRAALRYFFVKAPEVAAEMQRHTAEVLLRESEAA